jgi:uncharacterized protein (DUF1684 family)
LHEGDDERRRFVELLDYRRRVAGLYAEVRAGGEGHETCERYRKEKDELFARHPQSPLAAPDREEFEGLSYYRYDPGLRFTLPLDTKVQPERFQIPLGDDGPVVLERFATVHFALAGREQALSLFWLRGYGGGVFLPFRDSSNGDPTYGGGRYLLDTIKGADLGQVGDEIVIDFNYAYNPSCAYDARWQCPLSPAENRLDVAVEAGEKTWPNP